MMIILRHKNHHVIGSVYFGTSSVTQKDLCVSIVSKATPPFFLTLLTNQSLFQLTTCVHHVFIWQCFCIFSAFSYQLSNPSPCLHSLIFHVSNSSSHFLSAENFHLIEYWPCSFFQLKTFDLFLSTENFTMWTHSIFFLFNWQFKNPILSPLFFSWKLDIQ